MAGHIVLLFGIVLCVVGVWLIFHVGQMYMEVERERISNSMEYQAKISQNIAILDDIINTEKEIKATHKETKDFFARAEVLHKEAERLFLGREKHANV